jgi:membrane fusion protein (multidrug efflux system)
MSKKLMFWSVFVIAIVATFVLGFILKSGKKNEAEKVVPVEVATVKTGSIEESVNLTGWIKSSSVVDVKSKVSGRIESLQLLGDDGKPVDLEEGIEVKKGQQLAVIDHDQYLAQLNAAKAALEAAEVEFAEAKREEQRMIALFEGGSATGQSKDRAITVAQLFTARLASAKANLEMAQINLRESTIISPIDGVVTAKHIDAGNLINIGQAIVTVEDMKTVKIVVAASERYAGRISAGTKAEISVESLDDKKFEAEIYSVYPALDEQTHTIQIEIQLKNEQLLFRPGMFAKVRLILQRRQGVVIVPKDVILGGKIDEPFVYVIEDNIARKRIVQLGINEGENTEITEGLKESEILVVNGMQYLTDGIKVEIVRLEDIK